MPQNKQISRAGKPHNIEMGKRLRLIRLQKDLTQEAFAEILELSTPYYGKIERGENGLSLQKLQILHKKLGIDLTYLITGEREAKFSIDEIIKGCPEEKRIKLAMLINLAIELVKEE